MSKDTDQREAEWQDQHRTAALSKDVDWLTPWAPIFEEPADCAEIEENAPMTPHNWVFIAITESCSLGRCSFCGIPWIGERDYGMCERPDLRPTPCP